jgi:hypothetical protein
LHVVQKVVVVVVIIVIVIIIVVVVVVVIIIIIIIIIKRTGWHSGNVTDFCLGDICCQSWPITAYPNIFTVFVTLVRHYITFK